MKLKARYLTINSKTSSIRSFVETDDEWDWAKSAVSRLMALDKKMLARMREEGLAKFLHSDGSSLKRAARQKDHDLLSEAKSFNALEKDIESMESEHSSLTRMHEAKRKPDNRDKKDKKDKDKKGKLSPK
jgi:hypothetical protein